MAYGAGLRRPLSSAGWGVYSWKTTFPSSHVPEYHRDIHVSMALSNEGSKRGFIFFTIPDFPSPTRTVWIEPRLGFFPQLHTSPLPETHVQAGKRQTLTPLAASSAARTLNRRPRVARSPENRTQRHLFIGQVWATSPRLPRFGVGMAGLEPAFSCSQGTRVSRYPTSRVSVRTAGFEPAISCTPSRRDTQASLRSVVSSSCGSRTRLAALKGRHPAQ